MKLIMYEVKSNANLYYSVVGVYSIPCKQNGEIVIYSCNNSNQQTVTNRNLYCQGFVLTKRIDIGGQLWRVHLLLTAIETWPLGCLTNVSNPYLEERERDSSKGSSPALSILMLVTIGH